MATGGWWTFTACGNRADFWLTEELLAHSSCLLSSLSCCYPQKKNLQICKSATSRGLGGPKNWMADTVVLLDQRQRYSSARWLRSHPLDGWWNVRGKDTLFGGRGVFPAPNCISWREGAMEKSVPYDFKSFSAKYVWCTLSDVPRSPVTPAVLILLPVFYLLCCICLQFCQHWSCQCGRDEITFTHEIIPLVNETAQPLYNTFH